MQQGAYLNRIATAVPDHDVHTAFVQFAHGMLQEPRARSLFLRMAERAQIDHRYSVLKVDEEASHSARNAHDLYCMNAFPTTAERMRLFQVEAPRLLRRTLDRLALSEQERRRIRHVIVTSCTGMYAPGLDFETIEHLQLEDGVERTMIGFMGCYAAINALKQARHIVRSVADESVLVVNLELCTLHLQQTLDLNEVLSFLIFGDGCAASLISAEPTGLALESFRAVQLEGTRDLITWNAGDQGFDMVLSGQVPLAITQALQIHAREIAGPEPVSLWAIHPGGRSVLDAVQDALTLPHDALLASRDVLRSFGNLSSATVMFVLQQVMQSGKSGQRGVAMSFGPGLTAETMRFHVA